MARPKRLSDPLAELIRIARAARGIRERLQNGDQVADGDAFAEQMLEDLLDLADAELLGHELADQGRVLGLDAVEQRLHVLATEDRGRVLANDLRQVGGDDRRRVDDGIAQVLSVLAHLGHDPARR